MTEAPEVNIPNGWEPRPYQKNLWRYLEGGGKRAVAVWSRRSGKDSLALNWTASAAVQRVGTYFHCAPEAKHCRKITFDSIDSAGRRCINQAFPDVIRSGINENEMRIKLKNGSVWQAVGSDSYDALVGTNPVGIVFSEFALADPRAWEYVRPILAENNGWALFISTPRGENHFADLYNMAKESPDWFAELLTVEDTGHISMEAIDRERAAGMPESMIKQEFYCSFTSGVAGSYYGEAMELATNEGRITNVPWESSLEVHTAFDLGLDDATAIWFFQRTPQEIRLIDYLEDSGQPLDHYVKELNRKPYSYGSHFLPHDIEVREMTSGRSRRSMLRSLGMEVSVVRKSPVEDGINAVRSILPRCWFDATKCARGIKALRSYRTEYDASLGTFRAKPLHDWSCHAADAFRYLALSIARVDRTASRGNRPLVVESCSGFDGLSWAR
jgi:phage terminase large subunit